MNKRVDIVIPVYRPDKRFIPLLKRLSRQSIRPQRIILINTEKKIWDEAGIEDRLKEEGLEGLCRVHHITKAEFDHGRSRNLGVGFSDTEYFICMTQDALPYDELLIEHLLRHLDEEIKLVYARQIPYDNAGLIESFTRSYNYPEQSAVKSAKDREKYGIKLYFASNVCAAYERSFFDEAGGFEGDLVLNEDMLFAKKVLDSGKKIRYEAEAKVLHSHRYSGMEQVKRNFDIGSSHAAHPEVFGELKSEGEGMRLVRSTASYLLSNKAPLRIIELIYISACKYIGYRLGKSCRLLPKALCRRLGSNQSYWEK
ncbi:MAG: glycosyltransferase family 2 protein [Johnsonella sp.]|nr:glycosyltransferase family 2 protein [Johnsonella sp.]